MSAPHLIAGALARAGVDRLPPPARAYLTSRLTAQLARAADVDLSVNLGGLRDASYGATKRGAGEARFRDIDTAAKALCAVSFRAAARDWSAMSSADLAQLGKYPWNPARHQQRVAELAGTAPPAELGWWPGFGPSAEAESTFRGLSADWEAFERLGVGTTILPFLREDLTDWRKFRDEWKNADIDNTEIGGRLTAEVIRANRVRAYLKDHKIVDPALQTEPRKGVTVTDAAKDPTEQVTGGLLTSTGVDAWAKRNAVVQWITDPTLAPEKATKRAIAVGAGGLGLVLLIGLAIRRVATAAPAA